MKRQTVEMGKPYIDLPSTSLKPDTVYTAAHALPKTPSKQACLDAVCRVLGSGFIPDTEYSRKDMAMLYRYLLPAGVRLQAKTPAQWVALAVADPKRETRNYLCYLYCDGSRLIGCDGHRLHVLDQIDPGEFTRGYYDRALNRAEYTGKYADVDSVILPIVRADDSREYHRGALQVIKGEGGHDRDTYVLGPDDKIGIDTQYLKQAVNNAELFRVTATSDARDRFRLQGPFEHTYSIVMGKRLGR